METPVDQDLQSVLKLLDVLHDLQECQRHFPTRERALAITKTEEAIHWMEHDVPKE